MSLVNASKEKEERSYKYVTFDLDGEIYGIPILKLNEIIAYNEPTTIPNVPTFIKGVLNLRGAVVPVVDLRKHFKMKDRPYDSTTVIMILNVSGRVIGVIGDGVRDVVTFSDKEIRPGPNFSSKINTEFIKGLGAMNDKFIILLDIDKLLSDEELNVVDGV